MIKAHRRTRKWLVLLCSLMAITVSAQGPGSQIGREVAIPMHLQDGEEFTIPTAELIRFGAKLFNAKFTVQEGAGHQLPVSREFLRAKRSHPSTRKFGGAESLLRKAEGYRPPLLCEAALGTKPRLPTGIATVEVPSWNLN